MRHTEQEMALIREDVSHMWQLVISQLDKARTAFFSNDIALAREVTTKEKRVDAYELKIESSCDTILPYLPPWQ